MFCTPIELMSNSCFFNLRVKDEIVTVKIFGKGKKFDLGLGKQFDSVEDLIEFYKMYPFSVHEGAQVRLQQVLTTSVMICVW